MKYRKKPVVIEAWLWLFNDKQEMAPSWILDALELGSEGAGGIHLILSGQLAIKTLGGTMAANPGDWIIRNAKGELYPCKPDDFDATYEAVPPIGPQRLADLLNARPSLPERGECVVSTRKLDSLPLRMMFMDKDDRWYSANLLEAGICGGSASYRVVSADVRAEERHAGEKVGDDNA